MSSRKSFLGIVAVLVLVITGLALFNLIGGKRLKAEGLSITEGLPVTFNLVSQTTVPEGTKFVFRTVPLALMATDSPTVMNDPEHPGHIGHHGGITFLYVPLDYTISVFQDHLAPGQIPVLPPWWSDLLQLHNDRPDIQVVAQTVNAGRIIEGEYRHVGFFMMVPPPSPKYPCDPANMIIHEPSVLEYQLVVSGDLTGISIPSTGTGIIYRVEMQP